MTTGRINQVDALPQGRGPGTANVFTGVRNPCDASSGNLISLLQRYAMRNTAFNQDLHNDTRASHAQTIKGCQWKPFKTQILHALHTQLNDSDVQSQRSPGFKTLYHTLWIYRSNHLWSCCSRHILQSYHRPDAHLGVVMCRAPEILDFAEKLR